MNLQTDKVECNNDSCAVFVIMPVHNMDKFVSNAISSILSQTFIDFEFIIIDDASTDHTLAVIQAFSDNV